MKTKMQKKVVYLTLVMFILIISSCSDDEMYFEGSNNVNNLEVVETETELNELNESETLDVIVNSYKKPDEILDIPWNAIYYYMTVTYEENTTFFEKDNIRATQTNLISFATCSSNTEVWYLWEDPTRPPNGNHGDDVIGGDDDIEGIELLEPNLGGGCMTS